MTDDDGTHPLPPELRLRGTLRLSAEGVAKVLGDLEARVMRVVWSLPSPASARAVHARVAVEHAVALPTVITVLNELVRKGLLRRAKVDDVFHYAASLSEDEFRIEMSRRAVEGILSLSPRGVAASFVDVLGERDPAQLAELMELIRIRMEGDG